MTAAQRAHAVEATSQQLQLEVFLNGQSTELIGAFETTDGKALKSRKSELGELGLAVAPEASGSDLVGLDGIPGLSYRYDVPSQRIHFVVSEHLRALRTYGPSLPEPVTAASPSEIGSVLNYNLFASSIGRVAPQSFSFNGLSATIDQRIFSAAGTLSQSALFRTDAFRSGETRRLNTAYSYSDPENLIRYQAGDEITGGFAWTRPIRIGGLQAQRTFALRPDLVTVPLASANGSAAVPSTLDVFVNNIRTSSQDIPPGPFRVTNIPTVSGGGEARVVVRDAAGHETATTVSLYSSPRLLAPGLFDFSFEAGLPRTGFGTSADGYAQRPVAAGSWREGVLDWLTLEAHAEAMQRLVNGGAGAVVRFGGLGVATVAATASRFGSKYGAQSFASFETGIGQFTINASSQLTFGGYEDLASTTARFVRVGDKASLFSLFSPGFRYTDVTSFTMWQGARVPRALNRASVSVPVWNDASVALGYVDLVGPSRDRSRIVTGSVTQQLPFSANLVATAFTDTGHRKQTGMFVALSMPLGADVTASVGWSNARDRASGGVVDMSKTLGPEEGDYGWRAQAARGSSSDKSVAGSLRTAYGVGEAAIGLGRRGTAATAQFEGSVATLGTDVFLANRIDDGFAVVQTGTPGLGVFHENRRIGETNSAGRMLVTGLRSYQQSKIAIDTTSLPVTADVTTTHGIVTSADRAGVRVDFNVESNAPSAILVIRGADGRMLPAGLAGSVERGSAFFVGYDGQAFLRELRPENSFSVDTPQGVCRGTFSFSARPGEQVTIPAACL